MRATRKSRWPRRLGIAVLALLGLVTVALIGGYAWLRSGAGGERLRTFALEKANQSIQGTLSARAVEFRGNRLVLRGVELRDPEGEVVAEVETLDVTVSLGQLLHKRLDVSRALIDTPRLYLKQDEHGLNLSRAIASRHPGPPPQDAQKKQGGPSVAVEALILRHGFVDFQQVSGETERTVRLEELDGQGSLAMDNGGQALKANLALGSKLTEPVEGRFELKLSASGQGDHRTADVALTVAGSRLNATAALDGSAKAHVQLDGVEVDPDTVRAFLPSYPLLIPTSLKGTVDRDGDAVKAHLEAAAGSAIAVVDGAFDLGRKRARGVTVALRHVDLSELIAQGPPSDVHLDLEAEGGGTGLDNLDAKVRLTVPPSAMDGEPFGPVRLRASAANGNFELLELFARVPGMKLQAWGSGTRQLMTARGRVDATDLAAFSRTLGKLAGPKGLPLSGAGTLTFLAQGPTDHPGVAVHGSFPGLRYQDKVVRDLSLKAKVPNVRSPRDAHVAVDAREVGLGGRRFTRVHAGLESAGRDVRVDAAVHGYAELALHVAAVLDADTRGLLLSALELSYPEARWRLAAPARIAFRGDRLSAQPLTLRSGRQSLSLGGSKTGDRIRASGAIDSLELGRLPRAFVDPKLNLRGQLSARVRAEGTTARPDVQAKVDLRGGRFKQYANLSVLLDAAYARDRATGTFAANGVGLKLNADFDVPVKELRGGCHRCAPVRVDAHIDELKLEDLRQVLGLKEPLSGFARVDLKVSGNAGEPLLELAANGRALRYKELPPSDLSFTVKSVERGRLAARVELALLQKQNRIELRTPFTLAELLRHPPTKEAALRAPLELDADVRGFPLPILFTAGLMNQEVLGTLTVQAKVRGPALEPVADVRAALAGLSTQKLSPVDADLELSTAGAGLRATVSVRRGNQALLDARARVDAPPAGLRDLRRLARAPLLLEAKVGPVGLDELQTLTQPDDLPGPRPEKLDGTLRAQLTAKGSLAAPRVVLHSSVEGLGTRKKELGTVTVDYDYADARHVLELLMRSANGGTLRLAANTRLDVSYPAVTKKPDLSSAPLSAQLTSSDLDLSFLSGLTPTLRTLAGKLRANASASGTLGSPQVKGDVEWTQGRLALLGYGNYQDIHLKLNGDEQHVDLQELAVRSDRGTAHLTAQAQRKGERFALTAKADVNRFPVVSQDQLVATLSLRATAEGMASAQKVYINNLTIPEAHVELPDVKRKNLQKLDEPKDIVLVRNGVPINPEKPGRNQGVGGSGPPAQRTITLRVNAPRNLWVKGQDVNTEVGLSDGFRVELAGAPELFGEVRVIRGRVDVFGRRFDVQGAAQPQPSLVRFTGPAMNPVVDLTALYKNEQQQVTVTLHVTGEGKSLQIDPSSEPPLSESEIYTLLATGRPTLKHGGATTSPSGEAASLLGSLAASQLKKTLSSKLPLDVLSIEAGDQGLQGTKLEAGTYIKDKLYVGFTGRIGADPMKGENSNAVRLEYQLSKHISVEGEYGDARAGNADLIWSKEY